MLDFDQLDATSRRLILEAIEKRQVDVPRGVRTMRRPHPWRAFVRITNAPYERHERHERLMRQLAWNNRPRKYFDLLIDGEWVGPVELGEISTNEAYRTATGMRPAAFMEFS